MKVHCYLYVLVVFLLVVMYVYTLRIELLGLALIISTDGVSTLPMSSSMESQILSSCCNSTSPLHRVSFYTLCRQGICIIQVSHMLAPSGECTITKASSL